MKTFIAFKNYFIIDMLVMNFLGNLYCCHTKHTGEQICSVCNDEKTIKRHKKDLYVNIFVLNAYRSILLSY